MEYRRLGKSGLKLSALSYGAWITFHTQADENLVYQLMTKAFDHGVNFFDNAEAYAEGNAEKIMGNVLKRTGWNRSNFVVSTKIFWGRTGINGSGLSYKHILEGTHSALKRLQLEYVDLIFCHGPDANTSIEETVWAMNQVIRQGKAFYWGTSNWSAEQILKAYNFARQEHLIPPLMEQPQYNLFHRDKVENTLSPLRQKIGLGITTWSPLDNGLLSGKYNDGIPKDSRLALKELTWLRKHLEIEGMQKKIKKTLLLQNVANDLGASLPQLAIAWCLINSNVSSVITGASKPEQIDENMKALEIVPKLNKEVLNKIDEIMNNKPASEMD